MTASFYIHKSKKITEFNLVLQENDKLKIMLTVCYKNNIL